MFSFVKTPTFVQKLLPHFVWKMPANLQKPTIYLTFDDGPSNDITQWVLQLLNKYNANATFFLIGEKIQKNNAAFTNLINSNHHIGNHTFNHLAGWKVSTKAYCDNIKKCAELIPSTLFRPPYAKLTAGQRKFILNNPQILNSPQKNIKIVLCDVLSGDFNTNISPENCLKKSIKHTQNGSIIIFHDYEKAYPRLNYVLPRYLEHFANCGYTFEKIPY